MKRKLNSLFQKARNWIDDDLPEDIKEIKTNELTNKLTDELDKGLNKEQLLAITTTEGSVRVIAGAGSGKTRTLTERYVYIANDLGISTNRILCVTFTNKAAKEMKERVTESLGDVGTPYISTFHSFCSRALREDINRLNYPRKFKVMDQEDQLSLIKIAYKSLGLTNKDYPYKSALKLIDISCKNGNRKIINDYEKLMVNSSSKELTKLATSTNDRNKKIIYAYLAEQKKDYCLDYNDLINFAVYLLSNNEDIRNKWQDAFDYVQVDEFQDASMREFELVAILSKKNKNLFIVGDPDQTIYSFRHADVRCILDFEDILRELQGETVAVKTIELNTNYRSTPQILNASNSLIKKNTRRINKSLITENKDGKDVVHYHAKNTYDEARWVTSKIESLKVPYSDVLILYRNNAVSRNIEEQFIRNKIPYRILSGISFYQRKEVKDVLAILNLITFEDNVSFNRVINNNSLGIGAKRLDLIAKSANLNNTTMYQSLKDNISDKLLASTKGVFLVNLVERLRVLQESKSIAELLSEIITAFDYEELYLNIDELDKYENIMELKEMANAFELDTGEKVELADYLGMLSLYSEADKPEGDDNVRLMTIHSAKGLESPIVFVIGMNEGVMPSYRVTMFDDMEEERRIAYVAMTRAKEMLFLTESEGFNYNNSSKYPSRFIMNMDKETFITEGVLPRVLRSEANKFITESEAKLRKVIQKRTGIEKIKIKDRVRHKVFGDGLITHEERESFIIAFDSGHKKGISKDSDKIIKIIDDN